MAADLPRQPILIELSPGELLDRVAVLEITRERTPDAAKRDLVVRELTTLSRLGDEGIAWTEELRDLFRALKAIHATLWDLENNLRGYEEAGDLGERFINEANALRAGKDRRTALQGQINERCASSPVMAKSQLMEVS